MKPITLLITESGAVVLPHILIPLQTARSISIEDGRKLFLPPGVDPTEIVEPTLFGEWVLTGNVTAIRVKDETGRLPFEYVEIRPGQSNGHLVFLQATLPSYASLTLTADGLIKKPLRWLLPRRCVTTGGKQTVTGVFEISKDVDLKYAIFSHKNEGTFSLIPLEASLPEMS